MVKGTTVKKKATIHEFTMDEKLAFLSQARAYPGKTDHVQVIETHMSWVFLTAEFAYKLKKPVKYRLLDLRILDARFRNCREEVLLNKRLAPDIYLGIIPLVADDRNTLSLEGKGRIVDWLVRMKRIAASQLLDQAIKHNTVGDVQLKKAALLLATFYRTRPPIPQGAGLYPSRLRADIQSIHRQLIQPQFHLPLQEVNQYTMSLLSFLTANAGLFEERVINGRIRELHGDLRPEHICIGPQPAIIDCLEFSRTLRIQDTADELAFLFMECELLGNVSVEKIFLSTYETTTGDHIPTGLLSFFKLKRCCLRAYLTVRHIIEPKYRNEPKWLAKANAYLRLAGLYRQQLQDGN